MSWVFVDDSQIEANAIAHSLGLGAQALEVSVLAPSEAREKLLTKSVTPVGVLMDVDLSSQGERGSGPGLAQDLRVGQRAGKIGEFPIVRFAGRIPIQDNVKGDPGSDDLFDLKILKEEGTKDIAAFQKRLVGLQEVYAGLAAQDPTSPDALRNLLGIEGEAIQAWSHQAFHDRLLSALQIALHVAAGAFMRGFLTPTGLLIDDVVLGYRLGIDRARSREAWQRLLATLPFVYKGLGHDFYPRWWARGLDDWWFTTVESDRPLASLTLEERVATLSAKFEPFVPMTMPPGSAGLRPWRLCALSMEADPPVHFPVDPLEAVRFTPRTDNPVWVDPTHASLRVALQQKKDLRLNRADLERLRSKHGSA